MYFSNILDQFSDKYLSDTKFMKQAFSKYQNGSLLLIKSKSVNEEKKRQGQALLLPDAAKSE